MPTTDCSEGSSDKGCGSFLLASTEAGDRHDYSAPAFALTAILSTKSSGAAGNEYVNEEFFKPLTRHPETMKSSEHSF